MPAYQMPIEVAFRHCDPAGIVFYPRYVEMINDTVEHWFKHGLSVDFDTLHRLRGIAIPVVDLHCSFSAPSRVSESLMAHLGVAKQGQRSLNLEFRLESAGADRQLKLKAELAIVFCDMQTMRPISIPDDLQAAIAGYLSSPPQEASAQELTPPERRQANR